MGNPFLGIEDREEIVELGRVSEHGMWERDLQLSALVEWFQAMKKLSPEESWDGSDWKEESGLRCDELLIFAESSAEDNGMNVRVEGKVATPGVEDADEPDLCAQMSLVPGKLFQSCGTAVIE